ncbi:putative cytochrome p450 monooxygenase protein [Botrytis fragariae]|uniref:Putative cytochrome p450 monooxygenase protein n=1 Tax=Botrytis fragariae TaxID=1964551 RepID=A0A8H6EN11_9HELO|nr:putative cytochrome p450 monooxygenase protein [Botrytis fragariae]KAF5877890.1 putative cytochrome p450 monooxygenase protein [Botrytis fragariae]
MWDVFGPNISTARGADWQRQRKVTGAQFNEQNSSTLWIQALIQATEVLEYWKSLPTPIRRAGFGKPYSFTKAAESPKEGQMFNYRDSLALILENALMILLFGPKFLGNKWLPKRFSRLGQACVDFRDHMEKMVREEKEIIHQGKSGSRNLIDSLIMASDEMIELTGDKSVGGRG